MTAPRTPSSPQFPQFLVSLQHVPSMNSERLQALNSLGIHTVKQLLEYYPLESAQTLQHWSRGEILHDIQLEEYLDGDTSALTRDTVLALPLDRLRGLGERTARIWESAFRADTIGDLLDLPLIREARNLLHHARFQERPSAPDYLVPKPRQRSRIRYRYRSWTRTDRVLFQPGAFLPVLTGQKRGKRAAPPMTVGVDVSGINFAELGSCGPNTIQRYLARTLTQPEDALFYVGFLITSAQDWSAQDLTLGDVSHSIGLAPGQIKNIATLQWNRFRRAQRREATDVQETLDQEVVMQQSAEEQIHDLTLVKNRSASAEFNTSYEQEATGLGIGAGGGVGAGGSAAADLTAVAGFPLTAAASAMGTFLGSASANNVTSNGQQEGYVRENVQESSQMSGAITSDINNYTKQSASLVRSLRSTVVLEDSEAEQESATTTVLANYNHSHALNIQCYELLRRYQIHTYTDSILPIIYVPFQWICFDIQAAAALWDYLRPAVKIKAPERVDTWDAAIRLNSDPGVPPMEPEEARVTRLTVSSWLPFPVTIKFHLTPPGTFETVVLDSSLTEHTISHPFAPGDVLGFSIDSPSQSMLNNMDLPMTEHTRRLRIQTYLSNQEGDEVKIPYEIDVTYRKTMYSMVEITDVHPLSGPFNSVMIARLSSRFGLYQQDVDDLVSHLRENEMTYLRYLITICDPGDLTAILEAMVLSLQGSAVPFPEIADVNSLLGITSRHLILPLRRLGEMQDQKPFLGKAVIGGTVGPSKKVELKFHTNGIIAYQPAQKQIELKFTVQNKIDDIQYSAALKVRLTDSGESTEGSLLLTYPDQPDIPLDLFLTRQGDQPEKGKVQGIAQINGETCEAFFEWDASMSYQPGEQKLTLPEALAGIWNRADQILENDIPIYDHIDLPTDGLFWEAVLGQSNASEYVDPRRFTAWHEWPIPHTAPEIVPLELGQHEAAGTEGLEPTVVPASLSQITPSWYQPWGALAQMAGGMLASASPQGLGESLLQVSSNLSQLANAAGEQASTLTGSMANTAMTQAVEFGKQIADMTNTAMSSMSGSSGSGAGLGTSASPPASQTEKAGALNLLDEIIPTGTGGMSGAAADGETTLASAPISMEDVQRAQSGVVGAPLSGGGDTAGGETPQQEADLSALIAAARAALQNALDEFRADPSYERAVKVLQKASELQKVSEELVDGQMGEMGEHFLQISNEWLERFKTHPSADNYQKAISARLIAQQLYDAPSFDWLEDVSRQQPAGRYTIQDGDTLSALAQTFYGETWRWPAIYEANVDKLGADPDLILPSVTITIP